MNSKIWPRTTAKSFIGSRSAENKAVVQIMYQRNAEPMLHTVAEEFTRVRSEWDKFRSTSHAYIYDNVALYKL